MWKKLIHNAFQCNPHTLSTSTRLKKLSLLGSYRLIHLSTLERFKVVYLYLREEHYVIGDNSPFYRFLPTDPNQRMIVLIH